MTIGQFNRRLWLIALSLLLVSVAVAQAPPAAPAYQPSEVQQLRLKVAQQSAQLAQANLREAQQQFQSAVANLSAEGEKVKQENKWPADVTLNLDSLTFSVPPKPAKKEGEKKP